MNDPAEPVNGAADPVEQTRRRLDELLVARGGVETSRPDESERKWIRPAGPELDDVWSVPGGESPFSEGDGAVRQADDAPGGNVEQAKETCLRLLAVRARSRAELAQRLSTKGFSADIVERTLDRLSEVGLVDDADFAQQWVRQRHSFSGKGRRALAQELRRKGVAAEDAAAALDHVTDEDEYARATELVRRKLRTLPAGLDREKARRRLVGMLARRGYGHDLAFSVVTAEWDAASE